VYIVGRAAGQRFDRYAEQHLYAPLGIAEVQWEYSCAGMTSTGGGLYLRPRDLLRIGQLILQRGVWGGSRIISEEWLEQSFNRSVSLELEPDLGFQTDYGFHWWLPRVLHAESETILEPYVAAGWGGQYLMIYPERELILVMTGGSYQAEDASAEWHEDFFLRAMVIDR